MHTVFYEGATGTAGDPDNTMNPPAPKHSRAFSDPYVHYITDMEKSIDVIEFWFPQDVKSSILPVDYIILVPEMRVYNQGIIPLTDKMAIELITNVFFQAYCENAYQKKIKTFSWLNLKSSHTIETDYPDLASFSV